MKSKREPAAVPEIGSIYTHVYRGRLYRMEVVADAEGVAYAVEGVGVYRSPTAAAKGVVGDQFINGRKFWHMDSDGPKATRAHGKGEHQDGV